MRLPLHPLRILWAAALLLVMAGANAAVLQFVPAPPRIEAEGYILVDFQSGRVLSAANEDERMEPASLTKMMTAYAVFHEVANGHIQLADAVRVSEKAWRTPGSRMFIEVNTKVTVEELLKGMIIQSGNDASVALAEFVAGSEDAFATLMNQHAHNLGLEHSRFANATGLPHPEHYSTPRDMARLAAALVRDFPQFYAWYSERQYTYNNITQHNRNKLLWRDESVDGIKTGHTESAGYCLVSSAQREGMRLVAVVMGTASENARAQESQKLLNWGFRFFETHQLYAAGERLKDMRIFKGSEETIALGIERALYVTVPRGQYESLQASLTVDRDIIAPAQKGESFGNVLVQLGEDTVAEQPLVALESVAEGSLWQRLVDNVMLWFR